MTIGDKFGKMTLIGRTRKKVIAQCDCGNIRHYSYETLRSKATSKFDGCSDCNKFELRQAAQLDDAYKSRRVFQMYKKTSKDRKIDFQLTQTEIQNLIFKPCHYCGKPPSNY